MNVRDERALWMRWRLGVPAEVPWRTFGPLMQLVLFVLTALAVASLGFLLDEALALPHAGVIAGLAALAVAESLIRLRRWFFTGVEAALWGAGLFGIVIDDGSRSSPYGLLAFAVAAAIAGRRVRSPILGAISAAFVVAWFETHDLGVLAALVIGLAAMIALLRTWRRPSTEFLWIALVIVMPAAGRFAADPIWIRTTIFLYAIYAVVAFALALGKRHHAYFCAGGVALGIASVDFARTYHLLLPLEAKLALGGAILLGGSWLVSRALRERTTGFVTRPESLTGLDDFVELAATAGIPQASFEPAREGGGQFGGAGATGKY